MGALSPLPVDDLASTSINHPLSGNMGRVLSDKIDNIPPGHNFIEITSATTFNTSIINIEGRTMQNHGIGITVPTVLIDGNLLNNTQLVRSSTHPMYYDFTYPLTLTEGFNTVRIESDNAFPLEKVITVILNTPPVISDIVINYPNTQSATKYLDTFSVDIPISGVYDTVTYTSDYFSITNPTTYELTKTLVLDKQQNISVSTGTSLSVVVYKFCKWNIYTT